MSNEQVVLIVRFVPRPGRGGEFRRHLYTLVDAMRREPDFVNTIVHEDLDRPDELVLYEIWNGSRAQWQREQPPKAYRRAYEAGLDELLERRDVQWFRPCAEWGSRLTNVGGEA